jgi:hypothetical protein
MIIIALIFLFSFPLLAQDSETTPEPAYSLEKIFYALETIHDLQAREILSANEAEVQRDFYLSQAEIITGESLTENDIATRLFDSGLQSWWRFITFVNIIWVFASLIIVLSGVWLFKLYILPLLKLVPMIVYELLLYVLAATFIYGGQFADEAAGQFVAMPGVLGLLWLLPWSYARRINHKQVVTDTQASDMDRHRRALVLENALLTIIWGATAIYYESVLIGFLTVIALMSTIGFSEIMPVLLSMIGFSKKDVAPRILLLSFLLMMVFIVGAAYHIGGAYRIFETGVYWIGAYAFFGTLEVMASRRYHGTDRGRFWRWQVISVFAGVSAIFVGVFWDISALTEVGGTFSLFYILEKYIEIPNWHKHWAWAGLGLGVLLYGIALIINQYPEFFLLN